MKLLLKALFCTIILFSAPLDAQAVTIREIEARVEKSSQTMTVYVNGRKQYKWPVSTARRGKITPTGTFNGAQWLSKNHKSSLYNNAPMPYSIFYDGHYAIHGTDQISRLGRPASAGCVRLHPDNAKILFELTRYAGKDKLTVIVRD